MKIVRCLAKESLFSHLKKFFPGNLITTQYFIKNYDTKFFIPCGYSLQLIGVIQGEHRRKI